MRRRAKKDDVARAYGDIWDNLSLEQCLLVRGSQIIISKYYRQTFLNRIHESHRSETDTLRNIRKDFWYSTSPSHQQSNNLAEVFGVKKVKDTLQYFGKLCSVWMRYLSRDSNFSHKLMLPHT